MTDSNFDLQEGIQILIKHRLNDEQNRYRSCPLGDDKLLTEITMARGHLI